MPERRGVLLTGATGLLGQYLLRDLLLRDYPVAVLVRDSRRRQAAERIAQIVDFWSERVGQKLATPIILIGDLAQVALGLTRADRHWLGRHCCAVIHSAANLSLRNTPEGEPRRTNVEGTKSLLALCRDLGVMEMHHVSTAFVCGRRTGVVAEYDRESSQEFHNSYEESKQQAEQLVRQMPGIRATIYRPAVIVGDSQTGYTSNFNGLYRFLELAVRLVSMTSAATEACSPQRLPLSGDEVWNLVNVDWVSRAIVDLLCKPQWHGRTFHLVSRSPVPTRLIADVAVEMLNLPHVEFVGTARVERPSRLEQQFLEGIQEYWPYLVGNPKFDFKNTSVALPDLPPPPVDRPMLDQLIRFAVANNWGRTARRPNGERPRPSSQFCCAEYVEQVFPKDARRSKLAREAGLDLTVGIDVLGPSGGQWSCKWRKGELVYARGGLDDDASVTYHTDAETFQAVVNGSTTPQEAFFDQKIAITGNLETALKLAVLFRQVLAEIRVAQPHRLDVMDATPFPA